jgi:hypothetical protein
MAAAWTVWLLFVILAPPVVLTAFWLWRRFGVR